jgi:hypothetical protein
MTDYVMNPYLNILKAENRNNDYIFANFKTLYVICLKVDTQIDNDIYTYQIEKEQFNKINNNLLLIKVPLNMLKNFNHYNKLMVLSKTNLKSINTFNYPLEDKNLVLMILNINYDNLKIYLNQFERNGELSDIYKLLVLNKYFNCSNNNYKISKYLESLINIESSNYWCNSYNLTANLTECFEKRKFNLTEKTSNGNYLELIYKTHEYTDPSKLLKSSEYKYKVTTEKVFNKQEINQLFDILDEKQKFLLFCNMIVSKRYCHLVLNNSYILTLMESVLEEFPQLFRYLIGYAWVRFYFDESTKKSFIKKDDEFIFDINTASKLPKYPFILSNPKLNPYMPILVDNNFLKPNENLGGISDSKKSSQLSFKGLSNLNEFRDRFNIFCTSSSKNNLFEFINFEQDKIAISGSIMAACLQKSHPLLNLYGYLQDFDDKFNRYCNEYYAHADIDIMFLTADTFDYMDKVKRFYDQIVVNVCKIFPYAETHHVKIKAEKLAYLFISEKDVMNNICDNSRDKFNNIKKTIETEETKQLFSEIIKEQFEIYKSSLDNNEEKKQMFPDYYDLSDIIYKIRIVEDSNQKPNMKINYKYKIDSPHLNHSFELFMVRYDDFFATVNSFHLPCVRAYYDGNNVYLTPSCISAHMTLMNIDFKYFHGSSAPPKILDKYRMRGFGTFLNSDELNVHFNYSSMDPFWNNMYNINMKNKNTILNNCGALYYNHKIFQPRLYNPESFYDACPVDMSQTYTQIKNNSQLITTSDFFLELCNRNNQYIPTNLKSLYLFLENFQTVNENGNINPLEKWIIEAIYNISKLQPKKETKYTSVGNKNNKNKLYDISGGYTINHYDISGSSNNQYQDASENIINQINNNNIINHIFNDQNN